MQNDIYQKLGERLNKNPVKLPLIEPVLKFLKSVYTPAQAAIGADFPIGAHTAEELARLMNREQAGLIPMIEEMADQGLVFVYDNPARDREYSLTPFAPGVIEFQMMRGGEGPEEREKARLIAEMMAALEELGKGLFSNPEMANKVLPAGLRTVTVETRLPVEMGIQPYERMAEILAGETSFAVSVCHCRHQAKLTGKPCKVEGAPERACLYFGKAADFMTARGFAVKISKTECLDILAACEKAGLVHNVNNFQGDNIVLCNCCGCCCDFMVKMKKYRGLLTVAQSNFVAKIDGETCVGCGDCVDRCQLEAIVMEEDAAVVTSAYCTGCGNCVAACPTGSIAMIRRANQEPRRKPEKIVGLGV